MTLVLVVSSFCLQAQETYSLQDDSTLKINGTSTIHDWTVAAEQLNGKLTADSNAPKSIDFDVVVEGIKSERGPTMDNKMYDALKKDEHPKINFTLKEVKKSSVLVGALSIAGQSKNVEIPVTLDHKGDNIKLAGKYGIALADFGIEPPTAMFGQIVVGEKVEVEFDLYFSK